MNAERVDLAAALDYDRTAGTVPLPPLPLLAEMMGTLTDDGDVWEVPDDSGRSFRLSIEPDEGTTFADVEDPECYGRVEWGTRDPYSGRNRRPEGFTGRARIVYRDGGDSCWWEPPTAEAIGIVWTDEQVRAEARRVGDRIEYGYVVVGLTYRETLTDSSGMAHVVDVRSAYLGAVDEFYPAVVAGLVDECLPELVAS